MKKTIGIFAHVDAGKTTLSESILYKCGVLRKKGRIEEKNTAMDTSLVERERGITVFSDVACFNFRDNEYYLVDTPGHIDFIQDTERCMAAIDCAVLVISAVDGVESNTKILWKLLEKRNIPVLIFVNKCDRDIADKETILASIKSELSSHAFLIGNDSFTDAVCAEDENLLNAYLEDNLDDAEFCRVACNAVKSRKIFPVICGSALSGAGIDELLSSLERYTATDYDNTQNFSAHVFKVKREKDKRIVYLKIKSGSISVREMLPNGERISELRGFSGVNSCYIPSCTAGDIVGVCGVVGYNAGDGIGVDNFMPSIIPSLECAVCFTDSISFSELMSKLKILEDEEPSLGVSYNEQNSQLTISVFGEIQLEIIKDIVKERFGLDINFGESRPIYLETIAKPVIGYGHFEPLRHYSEVHLRINPAPRGTGISFKSECSLDILSSNYQNLIRTHVFEKIHKGVLIGAPLTDVEITLITGRAHEKHTEGGDFREATYRAIRQGLMKAESILLEPWFECEICVDSSVAGHVMSDIIRMKGDILSSETLSDETRITANLCASRALSYIKEFNSFTRGKGRFCYDNSNYREAPDGEDIIRRFAYDPCADIENTPDSVFCSHGAGHIVNWREVENNIHCK